MLTGPCGTRPDGITGGDECADFQALLLIEQARLLKHFFAFLSRAGIGTDEEVRMATVRAGLIQMSLKADTDQSPQAICDKMIEGHIPLIEEAGAKGVHVLCFQ